MPRLTKSRLAEFRGLVHSDGEIIFLKHKSLLIETDKLIISIKIGHKL